MVVFNPRTPAQQQLVIKDILRIGKHSWTLQYLGVSITGCRLRAECVDVERVIRERLEGWQARALSMMGQVILVRYVLSSILAYLLSHMVLPRAIVARLQQLFRRFLWGFHPEGREGVHFLAWDVVCQPQREDGLGIQSLAMRREALIVRHTA